MASAGSLRRAVEDLFAAPGPRLQWLLARNEFSDPVASQRDDRIFC
jgi:hypothetical protein